VWIGLSDHESEGRFKWIDGSNVTYTSWDRGELMNAASSDFTTAG